MEEQYDNDNYNPQKFQSSKIKTSVGHIKEVKYNPTGDELAIIGENCNFAEIWDMDTCKLICKLQDHDEPITCIAWNYGNEIGLKNTIMTGSKDTTIKIWDTCNGKRLTTIYTPKEHITYESPIEVLAIATKPTIFIAGNSAGLLCIRIFNNEVKSTLANCLNFKDKASPIYHASFDQSGSLVCIATLNDVKVFARSKTFRRQNYKEPWTFKLSYKLDPHEQLESFKTFDENHVFFRIKNNSEKSIRCIAFKIFPDNKIAKMDLPLLDYCEKTNKFLCLFNDQILNEASMDDLRKGLDENNIFTFDSAIKSAIYNSEGNQILVRTEGDINILEKENDEWKCIYTTSTRSEILLHPTNNDLFISISKEEHESDTISIFRSKKIWEFDESESHDSSVNEDNLNDQENSELTHVKRSYLASETDKTPKQNKRRKIASRRSEDYHNSDELESSSSTEDEGENGSKEKEVDYDYEQEHISAFVELRSNRDNLDQTNILSSTQDNNQHRSKQISDRAQAERKTALYRYDLICYDRNIFKRSLIEIITNCPEDIIQKYIAVMHKDKSNDRDDQGRTAVYMATDTNRKSIVQLLAEHGADVNIPNNQGFSPLHLAITKSNIPLVQCLLAHKALVNSPTSTGTTPLHTAVQSRNFELIRILLDANADMHAEDNNSNTPLSLVNNSEDLDLALIFGEKLSQQTLNDI